jgi:hypothetical protein
MDGSNVPQVSLIDSEPIAEMPIVECFKLAWQPFAEVMTFSASKRQVFAIHAFMS